MRASTLLGSLWFAALVIAQAVPEGIAPEEASPEGCERSVDGNFTIGIAISVGLHKRESASEAAGSALGCTLKDGVLKDPYGRVGSIVANYQFQFDGPPQAGAIYTGGFSRCQNESLALGGSTRWWRCMSGEFGNLYDRSIGDQCSEVRIVAQLINQPTPSSSSSSSAVSSTSASKAASTAASTSASTSASIATNTAASSRVSVSSTWSVESASVTLLPVASRNATISTGTPSASNSITSASSATNAGSPSASSSGSTGGAVPTRVPRRETFGAVVGILGAALIL